MSMPPIAKRKKKVKEEIDYDRFNKFCLSYKDYKGQPYFHMVDGVLTQNYQCDLQFEQVLISYRKTL